MQNSETISYFDAYQNRKVDSRGEPLEAISLLHTVSNPQFPPVSFIIFFFPLTLSFLKKGSCEGGVLPFSYLFFSLKKRYFDYEPMDPPGVEPGASCMPCKCHTSLHYATCR